MLGCSTAIERNFLEPFDNDARATTNGRLDPASESPLAIEQPSLPETPRSLFSMQLTDNDPIRDVIVKTQAPVDVLQQRLVGLVDDEIFVAIELTPPTGTYRRELLNGVDTWADDDGSVLCAQNGIATYDPRCETVEPAAYLNPSEGAITMSQWGMMLFDDQTLEPITSCQIGGPYRLDCQLSGGAEAVYRLVVFANGFEQLWDGSEGLGEQSLNFTPFIGSVAEQQEFRCLAFSHTATSSYCTYHLAYSRFNGIDRLRLELDPVTIRITANGLSTTSTSAALSWDAGDADLPGPY
ncbi:MAG: hypothetical protein AB7P03_20245 [Kofleriaceae bacterium]